MLTASEAFASARPAIFRIAIEPMAASGWWWGTGFFVRAGYALTAFHNLPADLREARRGTLRAFDRDGRSFSLDYVPTPDDEARDIALLRPRQLPPAAASLRAAALPEDMADAERVRFWAGRSVVVCGFPINDQGQEEQVIAGHVRGDGPVGIQDEKDEDGVVWQVERLRIVPDQTVHLPGISGGPVIDLENGQVVAVEGACDSHRHLVFTSELRLPASWPEDLRRSLERLGPARRPLAAAVTRASKPMVAVVVAAVAGAAVWVVSQSRRPASVPPTERSLSQASDSSAGSPDLRHAAPATPEIARNGTRNRAPGAASNDAPPGVMLSKRRVPPGTALRIELPAATIVRPGETITGSLFEPVRAMDGTVAFDVKSPVDILVGEFRRVDAEGLAVELTVTRIAGTDVSTGTEVVVAVPQAAFTLLGGGTATFTLRLSLILE